MPLFSRRSRELPLIFPRLDGSTWPDRRALGRTSFAVSTLYEVAQQEAHTPAAHDVTDLVDEQVLTMLWTGAAIEDERHMLRVCSAAAQVGAGTGLVERSVHTGAGTAAEVAAVLWLAADDLPRMPPHQQAVARYVLQCGYFLARTGARGLPELLAALAGEQHPARRPDR
jgi:hypothetical protein